MCVCTFFKNSSLPVAAVFVKFYFCRNAGLFRVIFDYTNTTLLLMKMLMLVLFYYFLLLQLKLFYFNAKKLILSPRKKNICQKMDFLRLLFIRIQYKRHPDTAFCAVCVCGWCSASWFIARGIFRFFLFDVSNSIKILHKMFTSAMVISNVFPISLHKFWYAVGKSIQSTIFSWS